jgi:hypothetical protein
MITPKEEERFQSTAIIRFEWTGEKDSGISLTIFNNMGKRIRESGMILDNNYSIRPGTLHGGLYYFEVLHKEEIIFFGKFTIEEKHPGLLK